MTGNLEYDCNNITNADVFIQDMRGGGMSERIFFGRILFIPPVELQREIGL